MPYTIPELVTLVPLQVSDASNYFTIDFGGLPNGEDCLIVHGHTSPFYKASQPAQTLIPNAMLDRYDVFSITFWIKFGLPMVSSGAGLFSTVLFAVMNASCTSYWLQDNEVWSFSSSGGQIQAWCGDNSGDFVVATGFDDGEWHLVTFDNGPGNTRKIYTDLDTPPASGTFNVTPGGPQTGGQYLSLGAYSSMGSVAGYAGLWRIGKLAFHDHLLTLAERTTLYNTMTLAT